MKAKEINRTTPTATISFRRRLIGIAAIALALCVVLGARLAYLQIDEHAYYAQVAIRESAQARSAHAYTMQKRANTAREEEASAT